jgi:hypothetical protein
MSGERDVQIDIDCCKYSACYRPNLMIHRVQGMAFEIAMIIRSHVFRCDRRDTVMNVLIVRRMQAGS